MNRNGKQFNRLKAPLLTMVIGCALLLMVIVLGVSSERTFAQTNNVIVNGDFENGEAGPWWGSPGVTLDASTNELCATVSDGGGAIWDRIIGQSNVPIEEGRGYTISFDAYADTAGKSLGLSWQEDGGDFTAYFAQSIPLGTTSQSFSYEFDSLFSDTAASFQLRAGAQGPFVACIDNVVVAPDTEIVELIVNGDFSDGLSPWWTTASVAADTSAQELCVTVADGGVNPWDAIVGQDAISIRAGNTYTLTVRGRAISPTTVTFPAILQEEGGAWTQYVNLPLNLTTDMQTFQQAFTPAADNDAAKFQFQMGGVGPLQACIDDVSIIGPVEPDVEEPLPIVRLNQTGYLPDAPKRATIVVEDTTAIDWTLYDASDAVVASGQTTVYGDDAASGDHVHIADFSAYTTPGTDYTLEAGGERSFPFDISTDIYAQLKYDALAYFYHNRSGIEITMPYAGDPQWTRPAGHIGIAPNQGDTAVTCFNGTDTEGTNYTGCDYTLDVTGGWYDAGDHGKYVVNGGISLWTMLNQYERTQYIGRADAAPFADGQMNIPENSNGVPDILDEARWQMEFMMAMQVPEDGVVEGVNREGMVHHKVHDEAWTGLGLLPSDDAQPRYLYPPSTAATLNMAATAAQCARIWEDIDEDFAEACLDAAEEAWEAALENPAEFARGNFTGGGPYDDDYVADEFYWAAAELFITTGDDEYEDFIMSSPHYLEVPATSGEGTVTTSSMTWQDTQTLGTISLALVPNDLPTSDIQTARNNTAVAADAFLAIQNSEGYLTPFGLDSAGQYPWGSNSSVINNMLIMAMAFDFTHQIKYLNGVSEGMDYLMGRNAMDQSYVVGYGERPLQNPHHRFWAIQLGGNWPPPYPGAMSGGPNSSIQDPLASVILDGCEAAKCFVDNIESWSTNEITINWNAPFAWATAFLDENANYASMCGNVLDDFNREGPRVGRNWRGPQSTRIYRIEDNALAVKFGAPLVWRNDKFGVDQEACMTLTAVGEKSYSSLLLKIQRHHWLRGAIKVYYDDRRDEVGIKTHVPTHRWGHWEKVASYPVTLQDGDQLAGQALIDGTVRVFVNGELVGEANAGEFFANKDGRLGIWSMSHLRHNNTIIDDFAGE